MLFLIIIVIIIIIIIIIIITTVERARRASRFISPSSFALVLSEYSAVFICEFIEKDILFQMFFFPLNLINQPKF